MYVFRRGSRFERHEREYKLLDARYDYEFIKRLVARFAK